VVGAADQEQAIAVEVFLGGIAGAGHRSADDQDVAGGQARGAVERARAVELVVDAGEAFGAVEAQRHHLGGGDAHTEQAAGGDAFEHAVAEILEALGEQVDRLPAHGDELDERLGGGGDHAIAQEQTLDVAVAVHAHRDAQVRDREARHGLIGGACAFAHRAVPCHAHQDRWPFAVGTAQRSTDQQPQAQAKHPPSRYPALAEQSTSQGV
jgi:hypothetical protein